MIFIMLSQIELLPHLTRIFRKGQYLFHQRDHVASMFFIETGEVRLIRRHGDGSAVILQRASEGSFLAEASLFTDEYHCDAIASARTSVRVIPRAKMRALFQNNSDFAQAWSSHLGNEVRRARLRAEILSLKTVAERLDAWIANSGQLPIKGKWKSVAQEIGTSAEALYREIASRKAR
jgi:CRP-like cAMP-binding protein